MVHGKSFGSFHLVAPVATNSCGTFLALRYFWIAEFDGVLGRAITVVIGEKVDFGAVDAALGVDLLEIGLFGFADHAVGGGGAAIGHDVADLDLGVGRTGVVFLLGKCAAARRSESDDRRRERGDT